MFLNLKKTSFAAIFLIIGFFGCSPYESLNNLNFEYRYNPEYPLQASAKMQLLGDNYHVFLEINDKKIPFLLPASVFSDKYNIIYRITSSYISKDYLAGDTLSEIDIRRSRQGTFYLKFDIPKPAIADAQTVILLDIAEKTGLNNYFIDLPVENQFIYNAWSQNLFFKRTHKTSFPILNSFVSLNDTILLTAEHTGNRPLYIRQYEENFAAALPPMAMSSTNRKSLSMLSTGRLNTGQLLAFGAPGLYFIQSDTGSGQGGVSVLVTDFRYPVTSRLSELTDPLIYIVTRDERARLLRSANPKEALDRFWLDIAGSREQARKMIRSFYEQVEYANLYFTSFKPGWKTDRGMIYIVFGKPDRVIKNANREEWYYQKNANFNEVLFTFMKKPTIFTPENYELVRFNEYDRIWYGMVDQWRKGILKK